MIALHILLKIKQEQDESLPLKARLVLHGNRNKERFKLRRDSAATDLFFVTLVLCIASIRGFSVATTDVQGAFLQGGGLKRDIFVCTFEPIRIFPTRL